MTQTIYTFARYQHKTSFNKKDYECCELTARCKSQPTLKKNKQKSNTGITILIKKSKGKTTHKKKRKTQDERLN